MDPTIAAPASTALQELPAIPWDVPERLLFGLPFCLLLIGDVAKKAGLDGWIIPLNCGMSIGVTCWYLRQWDADTVILGVVLGFATTGVHRILRQVNARA